MQSKRVSDMIKTQSQKFIVFSNPRSSQAKCSPKQSNFKDINNSVSVKVEKLNECIRKLLKAIGTKLLAPRKL